MSEPLENELECAKAREPERTAVVRRLFEEHNRALVSFLTVRLHSLQDARDVAQEAYVRVLQLDRPQGVSFLKAFLFKTASNLAIDRVRSRSVRQHVDIEQLFDVLEDSATPEREINTQQELDVIARRLQSLPSQCRYAFAMHILLERPVKDVARELGLTERMVRYYIVQALERCRSTKERLK